MDQDRRDLERELLVLRCQRGEREAFDELIGSWERRLYFYIRRLVSDEDDARQVLQDVWLQVFRGIHALRDPQRLPVWLYTIARNNARNCHRRAYARDRLHRTCTPKASEVEDPARFEVVDFVHHGLARLHEVDREVLTLFFLRDLTIGEVAELLGIPPGTVKSRLHTAKKALHDVLKREGDSDGFPR